MWESIKNYFSSDNLKEVWSTILKWLMGTGKDILIGLIILFIGIKLVKFVAKKLEKGFGKSKVEPTVAKFLKSLISFALYAVLVVCVITIWGIPTSSLIAAIGSLGLTVGLAVQGSLSNFAGGVLILLSKPFSVGDYIVEDTHKNEGTVIAVDLLYTKIKTIDNRVIIIPNGSLANSSMTNVTAMGKRRIDLTVGISYESNIGVAKDTLSKVLKDELRIMHDEPIDIYVDGLEDSQVTIGTRAWVATDNYWPTRWALLEQYKIKLEEAGVVIPFNQLTVSFNNPKTEEISNEQK